MMYQLPIDISARIASVTLATMSPPFHSASRPYGLSTSSVLRSPLAAAGAAGAAGVAGCAAAGGVDSGVVAGVAGCPCACAANGTTAGAAASSRAAASMARRVIFSMLSPGIVVFSRKVSVWPGSPHAVLGTKGLEMSDPGSVVSCARADVYTPKRVGPAVGQGQAYVRKSRN